MKDLFIKTRIEYDPIYIVVPGVKLKETTKWTSWLQNGINKEKKDS